MNLQRALAHPIESFRTAPVWTTKAALGGLLLTGSIYAGGVLLESGEDIIEKTVVSTLFGANAATLGYSIKNDLKAIAYYHNVRDSAEAAFARRGGYSEAYASRTLGLWCGRQATLVACEQFGEDAAQQYRALVAANRNEIALGMIPHI
ncbi:MAG TPA: hypothetical protein VFI74_01345 [Candidatus Saccharimonadales bacterium]|nr:hypothetical protein [Candidatus Saccharimonadales bacterium]